MTMKLLCKQPGLTIKHNSMPKFKITFDKNPVEVIDEVGRFLLADKPNLFKDVSSVKKAVKEDKK